MSDRRTCYLDKQASMHQYAGFLASRITPNQPIDDTTFKDLRSPYVLKIGYKTSLGRPDFLQVSPRDVELIGGAMRPGKSVTLEFEPNVDSTDVMLAIASLCLGKTNVDECNPSTVAYRANLLVLRSLGYVFFSEPTRNNPLHVSMVHKTHLDLAQPDNARIDAQTLTRASVLWKDVLSATCRKRF